VTNSPPTLATGWGRWRDAIRTCWSSGRSEFDRRLDHKSRMRREPPVRIREGLGVKLPRATRLVIGVAREDDARRIMEVLPKRMSKYGLTVHPEKTRLVRFEPPQADDSDTEERDPPGPKTFDFLGFTHYWGRSQRGVWVVKRHTAKSRLKRAIAALSEWCRKNLHAPIWEQHQKLVQKLRGQYGYYGIIGKFTSLQSFREAARRLWRRKLSRRRRGSPLN
jgi:RNA-directed DNA polymerase